MTSDDFSEGGGKYFGFHLTTESPLAQTFDVQQLPTHLGTLV